MKRGHKEKSCGLSLFVPIQDYDSTLKQQNTPLIQADTSPSKKKLEIFVFNKTIFIFAT